MTHLACQHYVMDMHFNMAQQMRIYIRSLGEWFFQVTLLLLISLDGQLMQFLA